MDSSRWSWRRSLVTSAVVLASLPAGAQAPAATPPVAAPAVVAPAVAAVPAAEAAALEAPKDGVKLSGGGSVRIREETFDNIPIIRDPPGVTRGGKNDYLRFRTILWGQAAMNGAELYGRINNEFRHWMDPSDNSANDWPDEIVLENMYLRLTDIVADGTVLTVGRQDIMMGSKRLVLEGTPKDGSRTIYMDGVSLGAKIDDLTRVDAFAVYNGAENDFVVGHEHRDLTGYKAGFNGMDESGAGAFVKSQYTEALGFEVYYIFKHDTPYDWKPVATNPAVRVDSSDYHTIGGRLLPKFSTTVSGELEIAGQFGEEGDNDVEAMMAFAGVKWSPDAELKPTLSANVVYLSGDDKSSSDVEGFNPLWGRYPWISELYIYAYDAEKAGFWSNLIYPFVETTCVPAADHKVCLTVGPLLADEDDGPGSGEERGWLGTAKWEFPLAKSWLPEGQKMKGHLLAEVLEPGDYYEVDDTAYFLRWEVLYSF